MTITDKDSARSLRSVDVVKLRENMRDQLRVASLTEYVRGLRKKHPTWEFPDFDPFDGGCNADILFLFEKPGPMTSADGKGSGFISRNNDDPTADATFWFMKKAGLSRERTVIWNIIPGWNRTRKVTSLELRAGVEEVKNLLPLLPMLRTIVLVGRRAQQTKVFFEQLHLKVLCSAHPSPIVRATRLDAWLSISSIWTQAGEAADYS